MPHYETSVEIAAPVHKVWAATCDIESWPSWSPTMNAVTRDDSGSIRPGSTAQVRQPKLRPATWVVDEMADGRNFTWHTSGLGYRITAAHLLESQNKSTSARLQVTMTGTFSRLLWILIGRTVRRYLDQEAAALKQHCETSA